jgi:hypothetical protein
MINTSPTYVLSLVKNFNDQSLSPFTTYCTLYIDYSTTCAVIKSASDYPNNYGGACPPSTFAGYGMSGYVCYVGNDEGRATVGSVSDIVYSFSLPSGSYTYDLIFKYLAYGADGYDTRDTAVAEVLLAGSTVWSQSISKCTVAYGTARLSGRLGGGSLELRFRLRITSVYGGWLDHRNFTVDDIVFRISKPSPPQVESPAMGLLIT